LTAASLTRTTTARASSSAAPSLANELYKKLTRALSADVDEAAWSSLYSAISRTFDKPKTDKIDIKVINPCGVEVLKVCEV